MLNLNLVLLLGPTLSLSEFFPSPWRSSLSPSYLSPCRPSPTSPSPSLSSPHPPRLPSTPPHLVPLPTQETECGDGTNLVVVLAGELLTQAEELLKSGLHPSEVIGGYNTALSEALRTLEGVVSFTPKLEVFKNAGELAACITPVIAAKQWGNEKLFASKIAEVTHPTPQHTTTSTPPETLRHPSAPSPPELPSTSLPSFTPSHPASLRRACS